jgi:hypothetical protein
MKKETEGRNIWGVKREGRHKMRSCTKRRVRNMGGLLWDQARHGVNVMDI